MNMLPYKKGMSSLAHLYHPLMHTLVLAIMSSLVFATPILTDFSFTFSKIDVRVGPWLLASKLQQAHGNMNKGILL